MIVGWSCAQFARLFGALSMVNAVSMNDGGNWWLEEEFAFGSALAELDGDMACYLEIADIYEQEMPGQMASIRAAAADPMALAPLLHEVANTFGVLGAPLYVQRIRAIEKAIRTDGPIFDLGDTAEATCLAMQRTHDALRQWLQRRAGG